MLHVALVAVLTLSPPQLALSANDSEIDASSRVALQEISVAELLKQPEEYVGKKVRVQGVVVAVGPKIESWMDLANASDGPTIRIAADENVTDFPILAKGTRVIVEGVFAKPESKTGYEPVQELATADESPKPMKSVNAKSKVEYQIVVTVEGVEKI